MNAIINGINLAFDDTGIGNPVLFIHGFPLCRRMWHPQLRKLGEAGYRVIAPDLRGFGDSDAVEGPYSMDQFADDIVALLDHLAIEKAVIGGMSMGGYVLFNLCERYPERLLGACFITTRPTADDDAGKARRLQLARDVMKFGPQVIADVFHPVLFTEASLTERPKLVEEVSRWMTATDSRGLAGGLLAMRERRDYTAFLSSIRIPSLAIGAAGDLASPPENARAIAAAIPGCKLCIVPDAGHMANLEHPGAFNRCLLDFFKDVCR
jgi:pimeloyl-ACP methyl ester carboxylesterase